MNTVTSWSWLRPAFNWLVHKLHEELPRGVPGFTNRIRSARRRMQELERMSASQRQTQQARRTEAAEREALEHSRAFRKGQRFRAGIEGRISVLFRGRGMKRCRAKGRKRFEVLVGAAALANNLLRIAELLRDQKPVRGSKAA